jgi:hypothetical protein
MAVFPAKKYNMPAYPVSSLQLSAHIIGTRDCNYDARSSMKG